MKDNIVFITAIVGVGICVLAGALNWDNEQESEEPEPEPEPIKLAVGQTWQEVLRKGNPWDETTTTRTIVAISNGWVQYVFNGEYTNTMMESIFPINSTLLPPKEPTNHCVYVGHNYRDTNNVVAYPYATTGAIVFAELTNMATVAIGFYDICQNVMIGPVEIDTKTGKITIKEGVDMDEASREFWRILERAYPEMFPKSE